MHKQMGGNKSETVSEKNLYESSKNKYKEYSHKYINDIVCGCFYNCYSCNYACIRGCGKIG